MNVNHVFGALASMPRRQLLSILAPPARYMCDLAARFGTSAPAVSRHLSVLAHAGLVSAERQGKRVLYRLNRDMLLDALARFASEVDGPLRHTRPPARTPRE